VEARYKFHQPDKLKITVYDQDGTSQDPRYWDEIGYVETTLGEIVGGQKGSVFRRELQSSKGRKDCGEVTVRAEELRGGLNYNISYTATGRCIRCLFRTAFPNNAGLPCRCFCAACA